MEGMMTFVQPFFDWLLQTTMIGSVVICLILLIQKMLGGRLGPRWCHALWLVLLMRMILPWAPSSRLSLFNLVPSWDRQVQPQRLSETTRQQKITKSSQTPDSSDTTPADRSESVAKINEKATEKPGALVGMKKESKQKLASLRRVLPILWLVGAIAIGTYILLSDFALWRIVKRESPLVNQEMLELFEECKSQMDVQSLVAVVPSDQVRSPGLFGFVRPRLLLPREMLDTATREEMRYVFMHELAHLKRRDIYLGWLTSLLQILHWFNPLVWFAFHRMRTDRELACDALVLTHTGQEKSHEYGGAIVGLLRRFSRSRRLPAMAGIIENRSQLKRRIAMITQFKNNSYQWSPWAIVLIIVLACISLPDAKRTKASESAASKLAHQIIFKKIRIPTKPGNGVLSPDGKKLAFVSKRSIWVVPVHGKVSPDIAGEPVRLPGTEGAWRWGMSWSADGKWLAYNTLPSEGHVGICIVPSSGGKVKRIVNRYRAGVRIHNYLLSLSPGGKIVAFTSEEKQKTQLFTVNVEGGDVNQLAEDGGTQPSFSPDGKKIAYVKEKPRKTEIHRSDVWVIPTAGGTPVQVSDLKGEATGPIWSPDGKMIAFTRKAIPGSDVSKEICIVPVSETGNPEASPTQIEFPLETWDFLAGWTLDNKIGVLLANPEHQAIYTVPAFGGNATQVTPQGGYSSPRWSPDGKRIYLRGLASVRSEGGEISISPIDADSMIGGPLQWGGNVVSPDGKKIVFCASKKDNKSYSSTHIYTIPVEGGEPKQLTIRPGWDRFPCWSPDGKSIAFIRYSDASWIKKKHDYINNICIVRPEGGEVRQLTSESDKVARATIAWSPDGKSIAYYSEDKTIRVIPVQGGEPRVVVKVDKVNEWWDELSWSRDGKKIAYSSKGSIWVVSLDGGEPEEIKTGLDAKVTHLSWSPDGEKIAFTAMRGGDTELCLMENFLPESTDGK